MKCDQLFKCTKKQDLEHFICIKKRKMSTAPLDAAPERRTEECFPRSRSGDRFWSQSSDTYRQAIRKRNVGPLAVCD